MMEAERYVGKKVRIILKNNFHYSGAVISAFGDIITINDKYSNTVSINMNEIIVIEEIKNFDNREGKNDKNT